MPSAPDAGGHPDGIDSPGVANATPTVGSRAILAPMSAQQTSIEALRARIAELEARETDHARAARVQDALYRIAEAAIEIGSSQPLRAAMVRAWVHAGGEQSFV